MSDKNLPHQRKLKPNEHLVCIDLPGQEHDIPCHSFAKVSDVYVLLRKWRDVVFDLNTGSGATYTVESTQDWIYDFKAKKRVKKATFRDGERFHIWVGRFFKGDLLLKSKSKLIGKYSIGIMDPYVYTTTGDDKPAPIIIALGKGPDVPKGAPTPVATPSARIETNKLGSGMSVAYDPFRDINADLQKLAREQAPQDQIMHVAEVRDTDSSNVPSEIAAFFKKGGEETAVDTTGIMTRNWLWAQITGGAAYLNDNRQWIRDLWGGKFYLKKVVHKSGPKWYVIFKGLPQLGKEITAWKYGSANTKVLAITGGVGSVKGVSQAAWEGAKGSLKKAGLLSVFFTIALDTAEWLNDYEQRDPTTGKPKKDFFDLAFKIGVDFAKAGISGAIASVGLAAILSIIGLVGGTVALPISALVIGTIALSIWVGIRIDALDKATGATDKLNNMIRESADYLYKKNPNDYSGYDKSLEQALAFGMGA